MYIPKRYGQSRIDRCPFCGKQATTTSNQGVPVCQDHKDSVLKDFKCVCGEYLDVRTGKFGAYFNCINCGNMNMKKALEINKVESDNYNTQTKKNEATEETKPKEETAKKGFRVYSKPKETTINSDDPDYF